MTFTTSTLDAFFADRERRVRQYLLAVRTDLPVVLPPALLRSTRPLSTATVHRRDLTPVQEADILSLRLAEVPQKAIAERLGLSESSVSKVTRKAGLSPRTRCGCGRVKPRRLERCSRCQFLGQSTSRRYVSTERRYA